MHRLETQTYARGRRLLDRAVETVCSWCPPGFSHAAARRFVHGRVLASVQQVSLRLCLQTELLHRQEYAQRHALVRVNNIVDAISTAGVV